MLQITPAALALLRSAQEAANSRIRRKLQRAKSARKLNAERSGRLTDLTARILKTGEPTVFAFEGACRAGIRASLCLEGWKWADADDAARAVIGRALNQIGAERPTWNQGQPEYVSLAGTARTHCARCGGKIDEDRGSTNGTPVRYCSDLCAHNAMAERKRLSGEKVSLAEYLATCAARSAQTMEERATDCAHCGTVFVTRRADRKFCSRECYAEAKTKWQDRECLHCGTVFKPKNSGGKGVSRYCSRECAGAMRVRSRPALQCLTCSTIFYPPYPSDKRSYCSPVCNPFATKAAKAAFLCEQISQMPPAASGGSTAG